MLRASLVVVARSSSILIKMLLIKNFKSNSTHNKEYYFEELKQNREEKLYSEKNAFK